MTDNINDLVAADAEQSGSQDQIDRLLEQFKYHTAAVKEIEERLKLEKEQVNKLQMETIPAAMAAARKKKINYDDGSVLSLAPFLSASLPSFNQINEEKDEDEKSVMLERRLKGLSWLRENAGGSIIVNQLQIDIPKGNDNVVAQLIDKCEELGLTWSRAENVHHMTLKSFLGEKIRSGVQVPIEIFKLVTGQKANYKQPKGK